jgi:hypothetical protein
LDWLTFFQTLPQVDLVTPLPLILSGLLKMLYDQSSPKPLAKDKKGRKTKEEKKEGEMVAYVTTVPAENTSHTEEPEKSPTNNKEEKASERQQDKDGKEARAGDEDQAKLKLHAELFAAIKAFLDEMLAEIKQSSATWKVC